MLSRCFFIGCILLGLYAPIAMAANIAIIIDDIGNTAEDAVAFELPAEVTFSILPHTPFSRIYSRKADQQQREVMLHMPMESLNGQYMGPGGISASMLPEDITQQLQLALQSVPNAVGVNNHMGSRLTQLTLPMNVTMDFLQNKGLYFVDSRTTRYSKAEHIAQQRGVMSTRRNVFLDHTLDPTSMQRQFKRLVQLAQKRGQAVGIAHPYPQSMQYLQKELPLLEQQGVRLVPLSDILNADAARLAASELKTSPLGAVVN